MPLNRAEIVGRGDQRFDIVAAGHIAAHVTGLPASGFDRGDSCAPRRVINVSDDDVRALPGEQLGDGAAVSLRRAGDDGDLAFELNDGPSLAVCSPATPRLGVGCRILCDTFCVALYAG